ncbi:MAG: glutamate racemase [Salinisphaera sp.]|nr:glutamate racemase [Salinisphaera sp.]
MFDSGVGGLSVLTAIRGRLPTVPVVFVMDTAGYPYGQRSDAELNTRVPALLGRLVERYRPRLVVIACNTASTIALTAVREVLEVPVVGTVPAIKPAALTSRSGVIGVLGTAATIRQAYVDDLTDRFAGHCRVLRAGAPALVDYAENRLRGVAVDADVPGQALARLTEQAGGREMDVVVLACTHFPLVVSDLAGAARQPLRFVDGAEGIARRVASLLEGQAFPECATLGLTVSSGDARSLDLLKNTLARHGLAPPVGL